MGLPCATLAPEDLARVMDSVSADPKQTLVLDLASGSLSYRGGRLAAKLPDGARRQLLEGTWNATAVLLEAGDRIEQTAARLAYGSSQV
jgi:3-isopropylmalate/(R)-2-methylmalate dehydratase small subunit